MKESFRVNKKLSLIIILSAAILVAGLLGGKWQKGIAQTIPTIPVVIEIDPTIIPVNSSIGDFIVTGSGFIGDGWDMAYTQIRWYGPGGPNGGVYYTNPTSINNDGTRLTFTIPAPSYFTTAGVALVYIDNHPDDPDDRETFGPYEIHIIELPKLVFLPIVMK